MAEQDIWQEGDAANRFSLVVEGERPLAVLMLHPPKNPQTQMDALTQKYLALAQAAGFDGLVLFSVYPQRAAAVKDLDLECNEALHERNRTILAHHLLSLEAPHLLLAFGDRIEDAARPWLIACCRDLVGTASLFEPRLLALGLTKKGNPQTLVRTVPDSLYDFDAAAYFAHKAGY